MHFKRPKIRIPSIIKQDAITLYTISEVYLVVGSDNTEFAGQTLAVCTDKEKAEKAIEISYGPDNATIVKVPLNSLCVNDKIVSV